MVLNHLFYLNALFLITLNNSVNGKITEDMPITINHCVKFKLVKPIKVCSGVNAIIARSPTAKAIAITAHLFLKMLLLNAVRFTLMDTK